VNYRFAPNKTEQDAIDFIVKLFGQWHVTVTDIAPGALPGLNQPAALDFIQVTGARIAPKFGWTDVARFSQMKTPAVNYGPGDPSLAHTQAECVPIDQVQRVADTLITWLS
jgi:succinyl-diaminopimelate desuccinylase